MKNINNDKKIGCVRQYMLEREHVDWINEDDLNATNKETKDLIQGWLYGLDEPWSDFCVDYHVSMPYQPPSNMNLDILWCAEYISVFYDGMESIAYGYGKTPEEAVSNVNKMVAALIQKYYRKEEETDE